MTSTDNILARVRKLLAKAEDPAATAEEAELYTSKAAHLVARYGIDRAMLARDDPSTDPVGDRVVVLDPPYAADKADLLATVATSLRCRTVLRTRSRDGARQLSLHLFGHRSDLVRAEILFTSLLLQATTGMSRIPVPPWEHKAAFRRSWLAGFRQAVGRRLHDTEQEAAASAAARDGSRAASTALVLADRSAEVESALQRAYPRLGVAQPRQLSGSGGSAGYSAGLRADLGARRMAARGRGSLTSAPGGP